MLCIPTHCYAQTEVKKNELEKLNTKLDKEKQQKDALHQKIHEIDKTLEGTRAKLVSIARSINENNENLDDLNKRIAGLTLKKSALEDKLLADKASISRLIMALERIRRIPPEAMIARPESPYKTAQSALLMADIVPAIRRHANALKSNLDTIQSVTQDLKTEKENAENLAATLSQQQEDLSVLLEKRKDLYQKTDSDLKAKEINIQRISLRAKSLQDLMEKLKQEQQQEEERKKLADLNNKILRKKPAFSSYSHKSSHQDSAQLPVSGIIRTGYGQKDNVGAKSNGLSIETRPGALVVAPMSGVVQFTGNFKRYGTLVIIEHANGYHSLVAGLGKIDTVVGQRVSAGEPIGKMPENTLNTRTRLYYELRSKGEPVNPSVKFADLG